ncbi:hypothetical protein D5086_009724 [Populus alba]|uniref:Uncharacterized protein n=1 Tax=Populus alba TaxID=43335 RepID=A0ACC4C8G3_POPAL
MEKECKEQFRIRITGLRLGNQEYWQGTPFPAVEHRPMEPGCTQNLVSAEVRGKVDGAFDSGLLMTATVNGKIFRGVLFSPDKNPVIVLDKLK